MACRQMAEKIDALIWPTLAYGHYPAFVEYAGNSSLSASTFETLVHEIAAAILTAIAESCSCSIRESARWLRSIAR